MLNRFWRFTIRLFAFVRKEVLTIIRQPRLLFSLILGPFLILLLFGVGYRDEPRTLRTLFVVPEGSTVLDTIEDNAGALTDRIEFVGITSNADSADAELREQSVDLVVRAPLDPVADWENNRQAIFSLRHAEIDPVEATYIQVLGDRTAEAINEQVMLVAIEEAKAEAVTWQASVDNAKVQAATMRQALESGNGALGQATADSIQQDIGLLSLAAGSGLILFSTLAEAEGTDTALPAASITQRLESIQSNLNMLSQLDPGASDFSEEAAQAAQVENDLAEFSEMLTKFQGTDSHVLVAPFRSETLSIAAQQLDPTHYYVPAVIALLMQHIAVTVAALSIVREKRGGTLELFQASPVSAFETLLGKYISFFLLTALLGLVLTALVIWGLGMPFLGNWGMYLLALAGILGASLGVGFLMSLGAQTNSQAIQYAMIMLLASIFFSGFFLPLYRLWEPVRVVSWLLPATYGTNLLQSIMLRGLAGNSFLYLSLLLFSTILFLVVWAILHRRMAKV